MKIHPISLAAGLLVCLALDGGARAQDGQGREGGGRRDSETVTESQKTAAKEAVSKYKGAQMSAADAKAVHKAMRDIGIRGGPAEDELLRSLGVDVDSLKKLDPPPGRRGGGDRSAEDEDGGDRGTERGRGREQGARGGDQGGEDGEPGARRDEDRSEGRGAGQDEGQGEERGRGRGGERGGGRRGAGGRGRGEGGGQKYSLEQAVSDNAQLHTIAFSGLAFLTGDFGASTFIPPGKVCDFFGFQYMRDIDAAHKGHNPMFLSRVAGNIAHVLDERQKGLFADLAQEQSPQLTALAKMRLPLIKAFHMQRDHQLPSGSTGLNKAAVMRHVGEIFARDVELSRRRAEVKAKVFLSLSQEQKAYLAKMKFGDFNSWPDMDEREAKEAGRGKPKMFNVAYMTYLSEFFSWTAGSVEADTYFCPERHGTYFGGFYMKDMPAMGKRNYDISTSVTGDSGQAFLEQVLTPAQRKEVEAVLPLQKRAMAEIIEVRRQISQELRKYLKGQAPDKTRLASLGRRYGELDGEASWYYTMAFSRVGKTLSESQRAQLVKLRNLDGYESAPYYIYSDAGRGEPELGDVRSFFFAPKSGGAGSEE